MSVILAYLAYFVFSTIAPIQRRFVIVRNDPEAREQISFAFQIMVILALGSLIFQFFSPLYFAGSIVRLILLTLTCGLFGMGYFIANYTAQKHVDAAITNVVVNLYTPITIFFSSILLHEGLSGKQILGTVLLLVAMYIISKKHRQGPLRFDKYFISMLFSAVCLGLLLVAERALQIQTGLPASTMLSWGAQCLFLGIATLVTKSRHTYPNKDIVSTGVFTLLAAISYVTLVFTVGNLSLVTSITTFKIVTIFIAAAIFLKERDRLPRKIFGSAIALSGLLLM